MAFFLLLHLAARQEHTFHLSRVALLSASARQCSPSAARLLRAVAASTTPGSVGRRTSAARARRRRADGSHASPTLPAHCEHATPSPPSSKQMLAKACLVRHREASLGAAWPALPQPMHAPYEAPPARRSIVICSPLEATAPAHSF